MTIWLCRSMKYRLSPLPDVRSCLRFDNRFLMGADTGQVTIF
jgi:hypothetical protein